MRQNGNQWVLSLAPDVLGRLVYSREIPSITIREMTDLVTMSWGEQEKVVFGA
jgi:hypothetical protein